MISNHYFYFLFIYSSNILKKDIIMYGIVNKAIQGLVIENFGQSTWDKIKEKAKISTNFYISNESYPDKDTFDLVVAASDVLDISQEQVLIAFGEYWVLKTGAEHYGSLLESGGNNFKEFMVNLPNFHSRVMLIYPNLTPPEFKIIELDDDNIQLNYYSQRSGLKYFVYGLIQGIGKMFSVETTITILKSKDENCDHDEFNIEWRNL